MYRVNGRTAATAATDAHCLCAMWNPHATQRVLVSEISVVAATAPGAGAGLEVRRTTARGTAGSTITPTIVNHTRRTTAPPSGVLLDMAAFSAQPTLEAISLFGWVFAAVAASGLILPLPHQIEIPPGAGLALVNTSAIAFPVSEVTFKWEE